MWTNVFALFLVMKCGLGFSEEEGGESFVRFRRVFVVCSSAWLLLNLSFRVTTLFGVCGVWYFTISRRCWRKLSGGFGAPGAVSAPNVAMSEIFDGYERQYCELSANLSRKCTSVAALHGGKQPLNYKALLHIEWKEKFYMANWCWRFSVFLHLWEKLAFLVTWIVFLVAEEKKQKLAELKAGMDEADSLVGYWLFDSFVTIPALQSGFHFARSGCRLSSSLDIHSWSITVFRSHVCPSSKISRLNILHS